MTQCVRILQCAGCRFDSPDWDGPEAWATQRKQDLWQTFEATLKLCQSEKVELLFLAGDIFDQEHVHKETVERVSRSLAKLTGTNVFIAPGEKDPFVATSAYRLAVWPSNVHIFSSGISSVKIPSQNVTVYGAGWTAYHQEGPFLHDFQATQEGTIPIMLLHAEVEATSNTAGFIPILPEHIAASGLTYLALGHQEGWSGIQKAGHTVWADSGFLEARSFGDGGPHGVIMGEIELDSARFEFREMGQRHYIEKTLELQPNLEDLTTKLLSETTPEERQRDLFRVKLFGPFPKVDVAIYPLQTMLAQNFRFIEVVHAEGELNARIGTAPVLPLEIMPGHKDGFPTLAQVFINKLKDRQTMAVDKANYGHWELVMKIGLSALGQGRIDDEN